MGERVRTGWIGGEQRKRGEELLFFPEDLRLGGTCLLGWRVLLQN